MDIKEIEKNYAKMFDEEIIRIATSSAHGLRPEIFRIIENEIKKRNLNPDLMQGVLAQNRDYSQQEIEKYSNLLRNFSCPICGDSQQKINAAVVHTVRSFIFFTIYNRQLTIACHDCLKRAISNALLSSSIFGWWGIPGGFIKTPKSIYLNFREKKAINVNTPSKSLQKFVLGNIGQIETYKDDSEKMNELIRNANSHRL